MRVLLSSILVFAVVVLIGCGRCPSGLNNTDPSCPNYVGVNGGYPGQYYPGQQPYQPYGTPYPGQVYPGQAQPYVNQPYPGQFYPGQPWQAQNPAFIPR